MGKDIGDGQVPANKTGAMGRNREKKRDSRRAEPGDLAPVEEKVQGMAVTRKLCNPEESAGGACVGKEGAGGNTPADGEGDRSPPCGVVATRDTERPRPGGVATGKTESGEEAGKKSDPARGKTAGQESGHVSPGPAKYS